MPLLALPTELVLSILSHLPTTHLLPVLPTCKQLYTLIQATLHTRIRRLAPLLSGETLILDLFHPIERNMRPALQCVFNRTVPVSSPRFTSSASPIHDPGAINPIALYTHYNLRSLPSPFASLARLRGRGLTPRNIVLSMDLDEERFTQLCVRLAVKVELEPRWVLGKEVLGVVERVFREWLAAAADVSAAAEGKGEKERGEEVVLWLGEGEKVGVTVKVEREEREEREGDGGRVDRFRMAILGRFSL
jgi:F-box associated protein